MPPSIVTEPLRIEAAVVVFDMDDTLYLERDFARSGFGAVGRQFAERFDGTLFARHCIALLEAGERGNIFDLALRRLDVAPADDLIGALVAAYREHPPEIALCADADRFLRRTRAAATGLISDGPGRTQAAKVAALGLRERIDHIVLTGEWPAGFGKPHPRAFEHIEQATGHSGGALVYIADNAAKDFLAPNRLGWQTVQILREGRIHDAPPPGPEHAAGHVVTSFDEIEIVAGEGAGTRLVRHTL